MTGEYLILIVIWVFYCVLHSLLAATKVKVFFAKNAPVFSRYYRLMYTLFSTVTLGSVFLYHYSIKSTVLIHSGILKYFSFFLLIIPGSVVMAISILKYFKLLSGIRSIFYSVAPAELKVEGIHKYVRHPLYLGTLLFIWGYFFISPSANNLIAVVIISLYISIGIKFEERKLKREFGIKYLDYIKNVPGLIPRFYTKGHKKG